MFKNKSNTGKNNICGDNVYRFRKAHIPKMSQRILAEKLQVMGIDVDKNAIQRIESGQRFVTDIELLALAKIFDVSCEELLGNYRFSK
ncbi:MAG: helix-turn-helix transcriptional regulator [Clostridia bacterium]|nr:helix-turn-helix transcriptional regulator [Clostridia bacterium]